MMIKDVLKSFRQKLGVTPVIGVELEFYFCGVSRTDVLELVKMIGIALEQYCSQISKEDGEFHYEIQTGCYRDIFLLLHHLELIKQALHSCTKHFGGTVDFSAKPDVTKAGNAFHVHCNLLNEDGNNLFNNVLFSDDRYLLHSIGGMCQFLNDDMVFFAPKTESYLRYQHPDINTPTTVSWGGDNRTVAIRLPCVTGNPERRRFEHRVAGADCNFEQVCWAILRAALYGIENKILPPGRIYGNAADEQYQCPRIGPPEDLNFLITPPKQFG